MPILDGISFERASSVNCGLGPAFGAMENMNVTARKAVMITGGGSIGSVAFALDSGSIGDKCVPQLYEDNPQTLGRLTNDPKSNKTIFKQGVKNETRWSDIQKVQ